MIRTRRQPDERRRRPLPTASALLLAVAIVACVPTENASSPSPAEARVEVVVVNDNFSDLRLYILGQGGGRRRLGYVRAGERATFRLPPAYIGGSGEYELIALFLAMRETPLLSGPVQVHYDARTIWTVKNNVRMSSIFVR